MAGLKLDKTGVQSFTDAVAAWVDYQMHCGRSAMLSEKYLTQPIAEFLGSRFGADAIHAEWTIGEEKDKRGRPRQMDFAVKSNASEAPTMVLETKWVNSFDTGQKQGVVMDIMRLHAFPWKKDTRLATNAQKLFVLAGTSSAMSTALSRQMNTGKGSRTPFLSAVLSAKMNDELRVRPSDLAEGLNNLFDAFKEDYGLKLPVTYRSTLLGSRKLKTVNVMVWEVGRV